MVEWLEVDVICWRCGKNFFPSRSGNCLYCGYSIDREHEIEIKLKQAIHDISGDNTSVYDGYDHISEFKRPNYKRKRT